MNSKNSIHHFGLSFLMLVATFVWSVGCTAPKAHPDPLSGWTILLRSDSEKLDQAIKEDYQEYVQKLRSNKNHYFIDESNVTFYEDGTGQHAIRIEIPHKGVWLQHVLVYAKDNKRIKVIEYDGGRYRC